MLECKAAMVSYTQASQARRVLKRRGIPSEIRRQEHLGPEGCGYVLAVQGDCSRTAAILKQEGIAFQRLPEGRDPGWS